MFPGEGLIMPGSLTADLAAFVKSVSYAALPAEAVEHLKLCILDTIGCGLFGSTLPCAQILLAQLDDLGSTGPSRAWGVGGAYSVTDAALVNGTMVHSFELDDLHARGIIHLGSVTLPPALALAQHLKGVSGRDLLAAVAAGYEVGARVGMFVGTSHLLKGFHPTGTNGTFAAAATAAKLLNLPEEQLINALGVAGSQSAGLMAAQYSSMVKRMHAGRAAQSGLLAALLAQKGFTGAIDVLEAGYGGYGAAMSDELDYESARAGLGQTYELMNVGFKPYACCGSNHTTIDALRQIFEEEGLRAAEIEKIEIKTTTATKLHVGWPYSPHSVTSAQMNLYYCAAVFALDGDVFIDQFTEERIRDRQVMDFISKIIIEPDSALDAGGPPKRHAVAVRVLTKKGLIFERRVDFPRGNPRNPMTRADLEQKFRKLAVKAMPPDQILELMVRVFSLEELDDVGLLLT